MKHAPSTFVFFDFIESTAQADTMHTNTHTHSLLLFRGRSPLPVSCRAVRSSQACALLRACRGVSFRVPAHAECVSVHAECVLRAQRSAVLLETCWQPARRSESWTADEDCHLGRAGFGSSSSSSPESSESSTRGFIHAACSASDAGLACPRSLTREMLSAHGCWRISAGALCRAVTGLFRLRPCSAPSRLCEPRASS